MKEVTEPKIDQDALRLRRWAISVGLLVAISCFAMMYAAEMVGTKIIDARDSWKEMNQESLKVNAHLEGLLREVGYGGFIHHWKNWILRRDERDRQALIGARQRLHAQLEGYRSVPRISDAELKALDRVETTFDEYFVRYQESLSPGLISRSAEDMEKALVVSDTLAIRAMDELIEAAKAREKLQNVRTDASIEGSLAFLHARFGLIILVLLTGGLVVALIRHLSQSHAEVKAAREHMDTLLHSSPVAMVLVDKTGNLRRWNEQATKLFGYDNEEMKGLTVEDLMPEPYREGHPERRHAYMDDMALRKKVSEGRSMLVRDSFGKKIPVTTYLSYLASSDDPLVIAALVRDGGAV
ncbi:MAG: PAS domain S-box protein [Gammaproteobacteria bacterium]